MVEKQFMMLCSNLEHADGNKTLSIPVFSDCIKTQINSLPQPIHYDMKQK